MRGRVIAVPLLLVLFLSPGPLSAQCSWGIRYSGQFRTTAYDVALDDAGLLWVATGYGVQLIDWNGGSAPRILDSIALPGLTRVVRTAANGIAYAATGSRIYVLRRNGESLSVAQIVDAGATVNDLALSSYLFAATATGIAHFDLVDPLRPTRTTVSLPTSSLSVSSLAISASKLYAADGDGSVEIFSLSSPALPQHTGDLAALPRASWVHASPDGTIFVSDQFGQNTDVFVGGTRLLQLPYGGASVASASGRTFFLAGSDRTVRAADLANSARIATRFQYTLPPSGGTSNEIHAMTRNASTLFVAAGDIGLVSFDIASMTQPFPLAAYSDGATTGVAAGAGSAWFSRPDGTIAEETIDAAGLALTPVRSWNAGAGAVAQDVNGTTLLTTAGSTATLWSLAAANPTAALTVTYPSPVVSAVLRDATIVALLADGSVRIASAAAPAPQTVDFGGAKMALLARAGSAVAVGSVDSNVTTLVHYYATGDFASETRSIEFQGVAIGGMALDATRVAVFTFNGLSVASLASGQISSFAGSDRAIPRALAFAGSDLLALSDGELFVWGMNGVLEREHPLPAGGVALAVSGSSAVVATDGGTMAVVYAAALPVASIPFSSVFYSDIAAAGDWLYLYGAHGIDVYWTGAGAAPQFATRIGSAGIIDIAATASALYTVAANSTVTAWSPQGAVLAQVTLSEGTDARPLSISEVAGAVWVSFSKGCQTTGCVKETLVLDPASLAQTATLTGAVVDASSAGGRSYVVTSLPDEVRVFNTADRLHPLQLVSTPAPSHAASIAVAVPTVYVLGDRLYSYAETTLAPAAERFAAINASELQRLRIDGGCGVVTSRSANPELYSIASWTVAQQVEVPSPVRAIAATPGRVVLLTGHSLEVWSTVPPPAPTKRRASR